MTKESKAKKGIVDVGEVSDKVIRRCRGSTKSGAPNQLATVGM